jgi:phosphoribosylaminoimidazole (AIR) synthetase
MEVGDAVEAGDVARAVGLIDYMEAGEVSSAVVALVVIGAAVGVRNSNIAMASAAEIIEVIQSFGLP